jgi:two-component system, chemotaxis family, chemotaxis protein CheY
MGVARERVLLVDDDDSIRQVVSIFLTDEGYEVGSAGDGRAALGLLEQFRPDLILLDLRMPVMDGWEFVRVYRNMPGPHAPIIAFVAALHAQAVQDEIGAAALLEKPFDLDELIAALNQAKTYIGVPTPAQSHANLASL